MPEPGDPPLRDGLPVSGHTVETVVSQVTWRALGPLGNRAASILDWAGLSGVVQPTAAVAARHGLTASALTGRLAKVAVVGGRTPLSAHLAAEATRPTRAGEQHTARARQARLLGLALPPAPAEPRRASPPPLWTRTARAVLAAAGPLDLAELVTSINRAQPARARAPLTEDHVADTLQAYGIATGDAGRWRLVHSEPPPHRYRALVDLAAACGRASHTTDQIQDLLTQAGYRAVGGSVTRHQPLLRNPRRGQWTVVVP